MIKTEYKQRIDDGSCVPFYYYADGSSVKGPQSEKISSLRKEARQLFEGLKIWNPKVTETQRQLNLIKSELLTIAAQEKESKTNDSTDAIRVVDQIKREIKCYEIYVKKECLKAEEIFPKLEAQDAKGRLDDGINNYDNASKEYNKLMNCKRMVHIVAAVIGALAALTFAIYQVSR